MGGDCVCSCVVRYDKVWERERNISFDMCIYVWFIGIYLCVCGYVCVCVYVYYYVSFIYSFKYIYIIQREICIIHIFIHSMYYRSFDDLGMCYLGM